MEQPVINNSDLRPDTPHGGKIHSKVKIAVVICAVIAAITFSVWYYFGSTQDMVSVDVQEVITPLTEQEKILISTDLEARSSKITVDERADMIGSLVKKEAANIKLEEREGVARILSVNQY